MVELHIEPLVHFTDLLLAIGLIGFGLSILAIVITVEICYFRKGGKKHGKTGAESQGSRGGCKRVGAYHESLGNAGGLPRNPHRPQMGNPG